MRSHLHCRVENQWGSVTTMNIGPIMRQPLYYVTTHGDTFRTEEWIHHSALLGLCRNTGCMLRRVFYNKIKHKEIEFDSVWIGLSHNWWPWWALVSLVTNFGFHTRGGICSPVRFLSKKVGGVQLFDARRCKFPSFTRLDLHPLLGHQMGYKPS
jgi:hypothetical protein